MVYMLYDGGNGKTRWYYDDTIKKIVVYDNASNSVGFQLNIYWVLVILGIVFLIYAWEKWY